MKMNKFGKIIIIASIVAGILYIYLPKYIRPFPDKDGFPLEQKWTQALKGNIRTVSTTEDGTILARTYSFLYAIEPTTGDIKWRFVFCYQNLAEPPIAHNEIVYFADDRYLYAVEQSGGTELWRNVLHGGADNVIFVSDEIILVSNFGQILSAYETKTGKFLWEAIIGPGRIEAYEIDGAVFVFDTGGISMLLASTGEEIWNRKPGSIDNSILFDEFVYFSDYDEVMRFDPKGRTISWKTPMPYYVSREFVAQGNILLVPELKHINALDTETGATLWRQKITSPLNPVIIGDTVYIMEGFSRDIFAFHLQTGKYEGKLHSSLPQLLRTDRDNMASDRTILVFSMQNFLYAYGQ